MTLVIMAAGMGSRFGGLKQIEPVGPNGEFILDYSIYDAIKAGFTKVVFIIKEENYDVFRETIGARIEDKIKVEYVFQKVTDVPDGVVIPETRQKPWGTGHAILTAAPVVQDNFAVINADDFYGRDSYMIVREFFAKLTQEGGKEHYCMAGYRVGNTITDIGTVARGVCKQDKNGYLEKVTESNVSKQNGTIIANNIITGDSVDVDENTLVSMNFWGFTPKLFEYLRAGFVKFFEDNKNNLEKAEYFIPTATQNQIDEGKADVKVLETKSVWHGVTYKEDKANLVYEINKMIEQGIYPPSLWF